MICVYASDCTDFSNNGLGPVMPQSCTVTETLNGEWELTLTHPIDEDGRWTRLTEGRILRAPVPAAMTPQIGLVTQQYQTTTYDVLIYKVSTQRDPLRLRSGTGTSYRILGKYKKGTEIIVLDKSNSGWYEVTCPDGKHGYMSSEYLTYVRTDTQSTQTNVGFHNEVIEARQLRDQPFRIYRVVPELDKVTVYARHVFYDLLDNMIKSLKPSPDTVGASVVQSLSTSCLSAHGFTFYSDLTGTAEDVEWEDENPVEALLGEGGLTEKYGAELARDWFDVFLVKRVGNDTDVQIRERKNLTGISYDVDETDVVTRIMPTGEDTDGHILYLPELYIDSPNIGAYSHPKWIHLPVSEAREVVVDDEDSTQESKTKAQCYADMRAAAQAEYDAGCDLPTVTLKVDFVNCADTVEYAQYAALSNIYLGDSVRVIAQRIGVEVSMRMTQYTYDCLTRKYTSVTLGTVADTLEGSMVSARQLASGSITGAKLALNSVGTGQLQSGSVGSLQIRNAAIGSAHIQEACITRAHIAEALIGTLNVNALTAVTAKIKELAAGGITTDELYTSIAMIATAQLTTANIVNAQIDWAQIENLAAEIAEISKAQITSANIDRANIDWAAITTLSAAVASMVKADIGTADIDWAHIKDLATDMAIITQGVGGELYIAKLAVTEANLVSLTVGELVVKGADGHFYSVSVDADGNVTSTLKQVGNDDVADLSIHGAQKLIEGSITAKTLNVQEIFADNATIRSLIAANLDVDTLFAREATINALSAMDITGNTYLKLMVAGKADQEAVDALDQRMGAAELKITPEAIASAVTSAALYAYERYEGRNYCLNSANVHTFVDNRYRYASGATSTYTGWNLSVSDDLFEHSGNGACIRISFDIKRTDIDASAASTANVYSGFWVYYRYYGDDGTTLYTTGRGWYLRTTDASFAATDDDWVRLRYGPLNLTTFHPVSIAHFMLGTAGANGATGTVQFRNVKLEVLDTWTPWSAAPEDLYGLVKRVTNAESSITQNANNIALKVGAATYNTEKVYRGSTAPTTLYTNMLWLDTSVSPNLLKRYTGSAWVAAGAQEVKSSGIDIGSNNVAIRTENFLLQLLDPANNENVLMEMSAGGNVGFRELYADSIISPSVVTAYDGPGYMYVDPTYTGTDAHYYRTVSDAVRQINNKYLNYDVAILFMGSEKEIWEMSGVQIVGICGRGQVTISGSGGYRINTYFIIFGCSVPINFQTLSIRESRVNATPTGYLLQLMHSKLVSFSYCTLDGNGHSYAALFAQTTQTKLSYTGFYNAEYGYEVVDAMGSMVNCKGSCTWSLVAYSGLIFAAGTIPAGSRGSISNGQLFTSGCTVDSGTSTSTSAPLSETTQYATLTKSYRGGWRTDTADVVQGVYSDSGYRSGLSWNCGCMWFGNLKSALSGKTVKSATLTLHRKTGSGSGSAKAIYLCAISNTSASGVPNIPVSYGAIGVIGRDSQVTFGIPIAAVQGLLSGTYGGLCLYEPPYNFGASTYSSCYMRMSGTDSELKPCLHVAYN